MPRESAPSKAQRYLIEGRVVVDTVAPDLVEAHVRGDATVHHVTHDQRGWACSCPARGRCAHLLAVGYVVAVGSAP